MYKIIGGDGQEYGPVSTEQLRQWLAEGRINAHTKARAEGGTDWQPIAAFPEFADLLGARQPAGGPGLPPTRPLSVPQPAVDVPNYLVQAILCTLCCCLPGGIVAIVYAAQVNTKKAAGDFAGAVDSSRKAKMWCWISFGVGLAGSLIWVAVSLFSGLASGLRGS